MNMYLKIWFVVGYFLIFGLFGQRIFVIGFVFLSEVGGLTIFVFLDFIYYPVSTMA